MTIRPLTDAQLAEMRERFVNRHSAGVAGAKARLALPDDAWALFHEVQRLREEINSPHTASFIGAVRIEAVHQRERFGDDDRSKGPQDWFWLLGWLAGKAVHAAVLGDLEKARHHTISSAAALLNWHADLTASIDVVESARVANEGSAGT